MSRLAFLALLGLFASPLVLGFEDADIFSPSADLDVSSLEDLDDQIEDESPLTDVDEDVFDQDSEERVNALDDLEDDEDAQDFLQVLEGCAGGNKKGCRKLKKSTKRCQLPKKYRNTCDGCSPCRAVSVVRRILAVKGKWKIIKLRHKIKRTVSMLRRLHSRFRGVLHARDVVPKRVRVSIRRIFKRLRSVPRDTKRDTYKKFVKKQVQKKKVAPGPRPGRKVGWRKSWKKWGWIKELEQEDEAESQAAEQDDDEEDLDDGLENEDEDDEEPEQEDEDEDEEPEQDLEELDLDEDEDNEDEDDEE